jgi:Skp family chaperone for outer membrane proteins
MIELVATVVITVSSVLLFGYWFRYTCLLILSAKTTRDFAGEVATANQLGFLQVQSQLRESSADLDRLRDALDRDYAVLMRLLKQAGDSSSEGSSIEKRMLEINYRLVGAWYRLSRQFSAAAARRALEEMSLVVEHFANLMGEQAASPSAA